MKRTQGSFFVGVNIANLLNTFRDMIVDSEKKEYKPKTKEKYIKDAQPNPCHQQRRCDVTSS